MSAYQTKTTVEARRAECASVLAKNPDMVPVVIECAASRTGKVSITALPRDATVVQLEAAVRDVAEVGKTRSLTLAVGDSTPAATTVLGDLFDYCKQEDGFLYVTYSVERTLGGTCATPCGAYTSGF